MTHNDLRYEFGPYQLNPSKSILTRYGEGIPLTPKATEILLVLVKHAGQSKQLYEESFSPALSSPTVADRDSCLAIQIPSVQLTPTEEVQILCSVARDQITIGNFEAARLILGHWAVQSHYLHNLDSLVVRVKLASSWHAVTTNRGFSISDRRVYRKLFLNCRTIRSKSKVSACLCGEQSKGSLVA